MNAIERRGIVGLLSDYVETLEKRMRDEAAKWYHTDPQNDCQRGMAVKGKGKIDAWGDVATDLGDIIDTINEAYR